MASTLSRVGRRDGSSAVEDPQPPSLGHASGTTPRHARGVVLIGELEDSGYKDPPCLVQRADGQTLQLTPLLYAVLEAVDGSRDHAALAEIVSERIGKQAAADDVAYLLEEKLRPLGVLAEPDGSEPEVEKANPLLALRWRVVVSNPEHTRRLTAPFALLFFPPIVLTVIVAFVGVVGWLLFVHGIAGGARELFYRPGLILVVFGLTILSAGFHEFGHAAACRYGGGTPGVMGAGLYLVWPAFYTDVTDSYRMNRRARLRVDLGGLYFNMVFTLGIMGLWAATGWDALLIAIPLQLLQMIHQLLPVVRLDGYYILADLTGVPDLFSRIKPTLKGIVPGQDSDARATALKPWVRGVVTLWVLLVIPLLAFSFVMMVIAMPRIMATAWDSLQIRADRLGDHVGDADVVGALIELLSMAALLLPIAGFAYIVIRLLRRVSTGVWHHTENAPVRRGGAVLLAAAIVAVAAFLLWPNGEYRPIHPSEKGTLVSAVRAVEEVPSGRPALTPEHDAELDRIPIRDEPVPAGDPRTPAPATRNESPTPTTSPSGTQPEPVTPTTQITTATSTPAPTTVTTAPTTGTVPR